MATLNEILGTKYGAMVETTVFQKTTKNSLSGKKRKVRGSLPEYSPTLDVGYVLASAGDDTTVHFKKYAEALKTYQAYVRGNKAITDGKARKNPITEQDALKAIADMMEHIGGVWLGLRESYNIGYVILKESGYLDTGSTGKMVNDLKRALKADDLTSGAAAVAKLLKANPELASMLGDYGVKASLE